MAYSSIPENEQRISQFSGYSHLENALNIGSKIGSGTYLGTTRFDEHVMTDIEQNLQGRKEYIGIQHIGDYLALVLSSDRQVAESIAEELHKITGQAFGLAPYKHGQRPGLVHANAAKALERAERAGKGHHLFNIKTDTVEARLSRFLH